MDAPHADFWESDEYREFVESLNVDRVDALRDLLIVAALHDELFTVEERAELSHALQGLPGMEGTTQFDTAEAIDHVDEVYDRYHEDHDAYLEQLLVRLGDSLDLSYALEAVVVLLANNDRQSSEANFARRLGVLMDVQDEFVEELLERHGWTG